MCNEVFEPQHAAKECEKCVDPVNHDENYWRVPVAK